MSESNLADLNWTQVNNGRLCEQGFRRTSKIHPIFGGETVVGKLGARAQEAEKRMAHSDSSTEKLSQSQRPTSHTEHIKIEDRSRKTLRTINEYSKIK